MNDLKSRNDFKGAIQLLLARMKRSVGPGSLVAYAGEPKGDVQEHTTRRFFLDQMVQALGWQLGPGGDMSEEARIKAETTIFMDYVGVSDMSRLPVLVIEAKAWDKPFVSAADPGRVRDLPGDLIAAAIEHIKKGGARERSPVTGAWHDYLVQVHKYVKSLKDQHGHDVVRVLLTSGQWMVIFAAPTRTFLGEEDADAGDIIYFRESGYIAASTDIFDLLARQAIAPIVPSTLRPSQLGSYARQSDVSRLFHGLHVRYEITGSSRREQRPRILVYPAVIVQRRDGVLLQVLADAEGVPLPSNHEDVERHLLEVERGAAALLGLCHLQLNVTLAPSAFEEFPGFPSGNRRAQDAPVSPILVEDEAETPNEWMLLTGEFSHYLRQTPRLSPCSYHSFKGCQSVGQQHPIGAINTRKIDSPRVFFTDDQLHHCAHLGMSDQKLKRCWIWVIDQMTCCQACNYLDVCWTPAEQAKLLACGR